MTPLPWSFSAISTFESCPRKFYETRVTKRIVEPEGDAAKWGNKLHNAFEDDLKGIRPLPPELHEYREYLDSIRARPGRMIVEQKLALDIHLKPCEFFDKTVWVRGKADVVHILDDTAWAMDHKSGKKKPSTQMILMALLLFYHFPEVQIIRTAFAWLKTNEITKDQFLRSDIDIMWQAFLAPLEQYRQAFVRDIWQPRPSGLCKQWCYVVDCEYNGAQTGWGPESRGRRQG